MFSRELLLTIVLNHLMIVFHGLLICFMNIIIIRFLSYYTCFHLITRQPQDSHFGQVQRDVHVPSNLMSTMYEQYNYYQCFCYTCTCTRILFIICHFLFLQVTHLDFAVAGGILFAETYSITPNKDREYIRKVAEAIILPEFVPKKGLYL